jgi:hypothetical protein
MSTVILPLIMARQRMSSLQLMALKKTQVINKSFFILHSLFCERTSKPARIPYHFPLEDVSITHCKLLVSLYSNNHVTGKPLSILAFDSKQHKSVSSFVTVLFFYGSRYIAFEYNSNRTLCMYKVTGVQILSVFHTYPPKFSMKITVDLIFLLDSVLFNCKTQPTVQYTKIPCHAT